MRDYPTPDEIAAARLYDEEERGLAASIDAETPITNAERWLNDPLNDYGLVFLTPLDPEAVERDAAELSAELHRQTESLVRLTNHQPMTGEGL